MDVWLVQFMGGYLNKSLDGDVTILQVRIILGVDGTVHFIPSRVEPDWEKATSFWCSLYSTSIAFSFLCIPEPVRRHCSADCIVVLFLLFPSLSLIDTQVMESRENLFPKNASCSTDQDRVVEYINQLLVSIVEELSKPDGTPSISMKRRSNHSGYNLNIKTGALESSDEVRTYTYSWPGKTAQEGWRFGMK